MFTWPPLYTELAKALQRFKDRQPELISILNEIRKTGIPIIRLIDAPKPATAPTLATIDPFTFFASFNRGLTEQNRIGILKILKEKFHLNSEIPIDFAGIPVVDNQQSWFFPYRPKRKPDDVESLWKLAEVQSRRNQRNSTHNYLIDACKSIRSVQQSSQWGYSG
jgi:5-methylcytosine-specific restriction protein B